VTADRKIPSGKIGPIRDLKGLKGMALGLLLSPQWIFHCPKMLLAFKVFLKFTPEVMDFFVTLPRITLRNLLIPLLLPHLSKG
jgi:hypothetical protein